MASILLYTIVSTLNLNNNYIYTCGYDLILVILASQTKFTMHFLAILLVVSKMSKI